MTEALDSFIRDIENQYPGIWKTVSDTLTKVPNARREEAAPALMPSIVWASLIKGIKRKSNLPDTEDNVPLYLAQALGTWRYTKSVYQFDEALGDALLKSSLSPDIPAEVFKRLPHWAIYIPLNFSEPVYIDNLYVRGFFVYLDYCVFSQIHSLQLAFMIDSLEGESPFSSCGFFNYQIDLDNNVHYKLGKISSKSGYIDIPDAVVERIIVPALKLVLYICSDAPEIENRAYPDQRPCHPTPKKTKKGWRLFPAPSINTWDVGTLIGKTLSQADSAPAATTSTGRKAPRPHVRRGHWHGYWVGGKENKNFTLKWLKPTVISG